VYDEEPSFPPTDQNPDAIRYQIGGNWVDAVGDAPTRDEVTALLNPPTPPDDSPVDKLKAFLASNPDVKALLGL
jgi:hypothetical protein